MKVRIQNDDGMGYTTRYTSVETGQSMEYISDATIHLAPDRLVTAQLTQILPIIDVVVEAEIKHVCPYCGQATGGESAETDIRDGSGKRWKGRLYAVEEECET